MAQNSTAPTKDQPLTSTCRISYLSFFHKHYLRNNRGSGKKNVRCFPQCACNGHVTRGFCGSSVHIKCPNVHEQDLVFTQFITPSLTTMSETGEVDPNPFEVNLTVGNRYDWDKLMRYTRPDYAAGERKKLFQALPTYDSKHKRKKELVCSPQSWSCSWTSNKHTHALMHLLRAYHFRWIEGTHYPQQYILVTTCDSGEFQLSSTKRFQMVQRATEKETGGKVKLTHPHDYENTEKLMKSLKSNINGIRRVRTNRQGKSVRQKHIEQAENAIKRDTVRSVPNAPARPPRKKRKASKGVAASAKGNGKAKATKKRKMNKEGGGLMALVSAIEDGVGDVQHLVKMLGGGKPRKTIPRKPRSNVNRWRIEEDNLLLYHRRLSPPTSFQNISMMMKSRTPASCQSRWVDYLQGAKNTTLLL